ncbi:hypothetical protein AGMMS49574_06910 [Bacteroidia bacterium]|nr:hypothetical protein AGMMS49574_06910 [Bacteroidia bacterium]
MKYKFFSILLLFILTTNSYSQVIPDNIPNEVRIRLGEIKANIELKLDSCRTNIVLGNWHSNLLSKYFFRFKIPEGDLYQLNLNWKMVYDDMMIERIIQLLNNKYREDELEFLVNRQIYFHNKNFGFEQDVMYKMNVDTTKFFKEVKDSLNRFRDKNMHENLYQNFDVFQYLKIDTTSRFNFLMDSLKYEKVKKIKNELLCQVNFAIERLIDACGYIKDERFVIPLLNIVDNSQKFDKEYPDRIKARATRALANMEVEPYYSNLLKSYSFSLEEIQKMHIVDYIDIFTEILHSQESFLELSKYLLYTTPTFVSSEFGPDGNVSFNAYRLITQYIENKDLLEIIGDPSTFDLNEGKFKIYDWMQKNYGKYEIKRLW